MNPQPITLQIDILDETEGSNGPFNLCEPLKIEIPVQHGELPLLSAVGSALDSAVDLLKTRINELRQKGAKTVFIYANSIILIGGHRAQFRIRADGDSINELKRQMKDAGLR